jgi:hypothetical protein
MMVEGSWRKGVSDHELGEEWGVDPSTVRHTSAEASRALKNALDDEGMAARLVSMLMQNVADARARGKFEAVARSIEIAARLLGIDGSAVEAPKYGPAVVIHLAGTVDEPEPKEPDGAGIPS